MSERVTWGACPNCGEPTAIGWVGDEVAEVDCYSECTLTDAQIGEVRRSSVPPAAADD
jgi:RNA polymerase-binding transcription factor DksA